MTVVGRVLVCLLVAISTAASAAELVFLDGKTVDGRTLSKSKTHLKVELEIEGKKVVQEIELSKLHKVTINGKTYVLNPRQAAATASLKTQKEVTELVDQQGRTPPEWFDSTALEFPKTLDLDWTLPAKPWNNQKNIGQYVWDIINPNPSKWPAGIRLMHHLLQLHQDDAAIRTRAMTSLASMYFRFFQDYPRAAFWWKQAGVKRGDPDSIALAECYWRLGNKRLARQYIDNRRVQPSTIKLLGDMGDTSNALRIAELYAKQAREPQWALLAAGDACRAAGRYKKAIEYYRRALKTGAMRNKDYDRRLKDRAEQNIESIELFQFSDPQRAADGVYEAESMGYEGPVAVEVRIRSGRIADVRVTRHKEKQFYSAMKDIPSQIIDKQSVKNIDATSRATITADAIVHASAKALSQAQ